MESILVIKVKCGDTLRRFNTSIVENGKLELNMEQLREKMRGLFNLAEDDDFTLTYTDTDGDSVTLVEDCDLDDVVLQRLNPVRMVLMLKTGDKGGSSNVRSSRNSTPRDSPRVQHQQSIENIQTSVEKVVMKNVPEPIRGLLLKLTRDLATTASAPVISDIIHSATKIGESFTCENSQPFARKESDFENKDFENKASEGETNSGLPGSKSKIDADGKLKAKETESGVCRVPDLNHAPPPPSGFTVTGADASAGNNISGKTVTRCPVFANDGSPNMDAKPYIGCPFLKTRPDAGFPTFYKGNHGPQFKRSHSHSDSVGPAVHTGVQCDICNVHPITGQRFKSKVRHNYDLCNLCYQKSGKEADYVRIDSPTLFNQYMKALHRKHGGYGHRFQSYGPFKPVAEPYVPYTVKPVSLVNQVKLDSCFILDVNVMDGTVMAPSTRFIKIWRMQNNGNAVWPVGTQLVWTDGDKFSPALSVDLEIPATGVPVEGEIDVAVDFVAPELPGEYVSYWRMSSPSGQRFGQRVWVAIQVDASPDPLSDSFRQLNLNLPYGSKNIPVVIDINVEPSMNSPTYSRPAVDPVETVTVSSKDGYEQSTTAVTPPVIETFPEAASRKGSMEDQDQNHEYEVASSETMGSASNDQDLNFPINDFLLVGDAFSEATAPPVVPSVTYPAVDSSKIEDGVLPVQASSKVERLVPLPKYAVFSETEESLLKNLSEMGFSQVDLNREILRKNGYDMEKTVVDLWDISEWDPIMDELEEMGFSDKKKNAILLVKNKGSIKRVVMDLVAGDESQ